MTGNTPSWVLDLCNVLYGFKPTGHMQQSQVNQLSKVALWL